MKERLFFDDEFERQLKEKSDQFKMYPSDKVWNEVYSSLHTKRRRFVAGMSVLIGGILILAGTQLIAPSKVKVSPNPVAKTTIATNPGSADILPNEDVTINPNTPFALHTSDLKTTRYIASAPKLAIAEEEQSNVHIKTIQVEDLAVSTKPTVSVATVANKEAVSINNISPIRNPIAEELAAEKTLTHLSGIHNERLSWEIYAAPTLNTHYLNGINYQTISQSVRNAPVMVVHVANVNGFVDNTPAIGYAVGGNLVYHLSRNISLKAGLEFSFNRYYIKVYNASRNASASLNSYLGYVADSLSSPFSPDISANKNPQHFQNKYYQLSMPIGVEMKVAGNGKIQFHLGANVQPSYLLNTDSYVLSGDYSKYTQDPQAFRRWNLIAGAEAFISYGTGKVRWELGPQVRYQIFSTYKGSNPLQENMINYGIRIGISKTIR